MKSNNNLDRLEKARNIFREIGVQAVLISSDANRRYFSGFTGDSGYLLITHKSNILFTDSRYTEQAIDECIECAVIEYGDFFAKLKESLDRENIERIAVESNSLTHAQFLRFEEELKGKELKDVGKKLEEIRYIKDDEEIKSIKKAIEISDKAFEHILKFIKPGKTEIAIATELEFFMKKKGAEGTSFDTIVLSGERTSLPHGKPSKRKVQENDIVLMDYGCKYNGYCSDMTRVVFVGKPDKELKQIYNVVLDANNLAVMGIKEGMKGKDVDKIARDYISRNGYEGKFGHALGHSVGLEIHESPNFSPKDENVLKNGMVITVEPGIYIEKVGGVRIEDMILINNNHAEILTKSPKKGIVI